MNKKDYRLIFMGTPEIAAFVFESMIQDGYHFVGLIAQSDSPQGRKNILTKVPTKIVAEKYGIPVFQPEKIRLDYEFVKALKPDLIVTFAYGQIIPQGLLDIPRLGCLNLHGSILPKYRGAAPIQRAIMAGETKTGITLMEMID
ncbi:MAG TPA: methionyl-tRNA formyltransferase, partial [Bacilli bacterium]|nr:methionyl-tRNA formyltransferase [Bacilli bacterium]